MTALQQLQLNSGVEPDGVFGAKTFNAASKYLKIATRLRAVHFFAQVAHETGGFRVFEENLNYSKEGLLRVFPKYFKKDVERFVRNPEGVANRVYAGRMGNKDSGDGWKYRGRGALQLTGRSNYSLFSDYMGDENIVLNPDVVSGVYAFESAMFFFLKNGLWELCDQGLDLDVIKKITKRINGGYNGLEDRILLTEKYAIFIK